MIGAGLLDLADIANAISGDFHTMHLNYHGEEFDSFHKEVLKDYYEQAAEDYDTWSEAAGMFNVISQTKNNSAARIEWQSFEGSCGRAECINRTNVILGEYLKALAVMYYALNKPNADYNCIGVQNTIQTRIEYWSKELSYFNARRI